jgi:hypothetical protein
MSRSSTASNAKAALYRLPRPGEPSGNGNGDDAVRLFDDPATEHPCLVTAFTSATGFSRVRDLPTATADFEALVDRIRRRRQAQPVVLRNFAADWPALRRWNRDHLLSRYRDRRVEAAVGLPAHGVPFLATERGVRRTMTLASFWDEMDRAGRCYLEQQVLSRFPGLERDLRMADLVGRDPRREPNLWLGRGTKSGLHYDPADNFLVMIRGHKLIVMAEPRAIVRLHPFHDTVMKSRLDVERPDFARFPSARDVEMQVGRLAAGDVLYIPAGWWHYVSSAADDYHLSVNCWFGDELPLAALAKNLLRLGPRHITRLASDFLVRGLLGRPFDARFHSLPDGVKLYRSVRDRLRPSRTDTRRHP